MRTIDAEDFYHQVEVNSYLDLSDGNKVIDLPTIKQMLLKDMTEIKEEKKNMLEIHLVNGDIVYKEITKEEMLVQLRTSWLIVCHDLHEKEIYVPVHSIASYQENDL